MHGMLVKIIMIMIRGSLLGKTSLPALYMRRTIININQSSDCLNIKKKIPTKIVVCEQALLRV